MCTAVTTQRHHGHVPLCVLYPLYNVADDDPVTKKDTNCADESGKKLCSVFSKVNKRCLVVAASTSHAVNTSAFSTLEGCIWPISPFTLSSYGV